MLDPVMDLNKPGGKMDIKQKLNEWAQLINDELDKLVVVRQTPEKNIYDAMRYSLLAGGKRLRPVLSLGVCEMLGGDMNEVLPFACALEMIHTYSLIHDDLPAMDNDDYRRGRLTNHKVYGEATAILAGDALLNFAFEVMADAALKDTGKMQKRLKALKIIAEAAGTRGMIGGQVVDLESEGKVISGELLKYMHSCKTGALIKASVMSSAILCDASDEEMSLLCDYASNIGIAFQIKDDILDVEGNPEIMGKKVGSDASNKKSTYVTLYGIDESKKMLESITNQAIENLRMFGEKGEFLIELAKFLVGRVN